MLSFEKKTHSKHSSMPRRFGFAFNCLLLIAVVLLACTSTIHADLTTAAIGANEYANKVALYTTKNFYLYWNADKTANVRCEIMTCFKTTFIFSHCKHFFNEFFRIIFSSRLFPQTTIFVLLTPCSGLNSP